MTWKVLIAHAKGEEEIAEHLAVPLREAGYEVSHQGTVFVGESVLDDASKVLSLGGPVVLCGTVRAVGTSWARLVVNAARNYSGVRVFALQMEQDADVETVPFHGKIAKYWQDPSKAMKDLIVALNRYYPLDETQAQVQSCSDAEEHYRELLLKSCDIVNLANLPEQDRNLAQRQLELRRLYVPLRVWIEAESKQNDEELDWVMLESHRSTRLRNRIRDEDAFHERQRLPVGERLAKARQLVVLGDPGSGKTTLIRWIATAYLLRLKSDPDWQDLPDVKTLPDEDWLPIIIRCRDLGSKCTSGSLDDFLQLTFRKAELTESESKFLQDAIRTRLAEGAALLMIDGLDEITDPKARACFCQQLEKIHIAYPKAPIIATSRIVGYKEMGQRLGRGFEHVTLADLSKEEKDDFSSRWCNLTELPERRDDATRELIRDIHSAERIERMTGNPMLLTTMALVKRKVGKLPSRRADLYWEGVQVLLNWRREVDEPLDWHEAIPQLEYIAYEMCDGGKQQLRSDEILGLVNKMRTEYPNVHQVRNHTPEEFLHSLEARTGLLIEVGYAHHLGMDIPVYEFRHLTFQEYLAARALVDGRFPGRDPTRSLAEHVAPLAGRTEEKSKWTGMREVGVVESWREALRLCTTICQDDDVDGVLHAILNPLENDSVVTQRARAILATMCVADEPNLSESTVRDILSHFSSHVGDGDGNWPPESDADFAAMDVARSRWNTQLRTSLVKEFCCCNLDKRYRIGLLCGKVGAHCAPENKAASDIWKENLIITISERTDSDVIDAALTLAELIGMERREKVTNRYESTFIPNIHKVVKALLSRPSDRASMSYAVAKALLMIHKYVIPAKRWQLAPKQITCIQSSINDLNSDVGAVYFLTKIMSKGVSAIVVKSILIKLKDLNPGVRGFAAGVLGNIGEKRAVEPLLTCLDDPDPVTRRFVAIALGNIRDHRAVEPLLARLADPDQVTRRSVAIALGNIGDHRAVEPLLARLDDPDLAVRQRVIGALGDIRDDRAVEPLLARLADPDQGIRRKVVAALGMIRDDRAVEPLLACLDDPDPVTRRFVAIALGNIRDHRAVEPLLSHLDDPDLAVRQRVIGALGDIRDDRAVEPLLARLVNPDPGTHQFVAIALGYIRDKRAIEPLLARLADPDQGIQKKVVAALGMIGDDRAVEPLLARLTDPDLAMQQRVIGALGNIRDKRAVEPLLARLADPDPYIRKRLIDALRNIGDKKAVESFLIHLDDPDPSIRRKVVGALGTIGDERAIEPLLAHLDDPDKITRKKVTGVLTRSFHMKF